jgi:prophage antirepressor-like protein
MQILTKNFQNFQVRIILFDSKEYFVAKDIAEVLEYKRPAKAISDHCKNILNLKEILSSPILGSSKDENISYFRNLFGTSWAKTQIIQEPDVWRLIIKSEMPEAEKIETWIFEEVLPSIRKTGKYELENSQLTQTPQILENIDLDLQISQNKKLLEFIELITSQNPINLFYLDKIYKNFSEKSPLNLLSIDLNSYYFIPTELGKFLNKSAVEINKILEHKGYQTKINGVWQLTDSGKKYAIQLDNNFSTIKWKLESLV